MPSQSIQVSEAHVRITIPLIRYLQRESLTALEHNLVLYIIEHSINFSSVKNHGKPLWVEISPSRYAEEFGHHRVSISKSLSRLAYLGIFESVLIKKLGAEYRSFRVVETEKINKVLSDSVYINSKKPNRKPPSPVVSSLQQNNEESSINSACTVVSSLHSKSKKTNENSLACSDARYGHVAMRSTAMYRCALRPCSDARYGHEEITDKFQGISNFQECINNLKEYFKNDSNFCSPSYFDLILSSLRTRRERKDLSITLKRSVDHYGLFAVWIAINVHLENKTLHFANYDVLNAILKTNQKEIKEVWENILMQFDNLFFELVEYENKCSSKMQNFEVHAQLFLSSKRTQEEKSLIFFFDSFEHTAFNSYLISAGNVDSFREKLIKKTNLFFKSKILGERELIYDEVRESLMEGGN